MLLPNFLKTINLPITGLSEDNKVQTPAFTNAVRLYRQAQGHYGTWEMMCGAPSQVNMAFMNVIDLICQESEVAVRSVLHTVFLPFLV